MTRQVASQPGAQLHSPEAESAATVSLQLSMVFLVSTLGAEGVALGYTIARAHIAGANAFFWLGQVVTFAPLVIYVVRTHLPSGRAAAGAALILGVVPYMIKVFYSPTRLAFSDELQHRLGTVTALTSHRLGGPNLALPISGHFPGLESVGAALTAMTGLPVDVAALIVGGLLKVAMMMALLLFLTELTRSNRLVIIGLILYAANGNFEIFSSFYIYQSAAIPFAFFTLYLALRLHRSPHYPVRTVVTAIVCIVLTVLSHHITGLFLAAVLVLVALYSVVRNAEQKLLSGVLAIAAVAIEGGWLLFEAPGIGAYLRPYEFFLPATSITLDIPLPTRFVPIPKAPIADLVFNRLGLGLIVVLVGVGLYLVVRHKVAAQWPAPWRFASLVIVGLLILSALIAAGLPFGLQAASRGLVFTYLGAAAVGALAIDWLLSNGAVKRQVLSAVVMLLCIGGGLEFGWPPWWEKLPGTYHPTGYETGVDPQVLSAASWVSAHVARDSRFAADGNGAVVLAGLANQAVQLRGAPIFYDAAFTTSDITVINKYAIRYIWTDTRVAGSISPSNRYFAGQVGVQYSFPPPLAGLTKWDSIPGVSKIYNSGTITIYDLSGADFNAHE